jgi:hypothetical protein
MTRVSGLKAIPMPNERDSRTYYDIAVHHLNVILWVYEHLNQNQLGYEPSCPACPEIFLERYLARNSH